MSYKRFNDASEEIELFQYGNFSNSQNPLLSINSLDIDDTSSVVYTSHSGSSSNVSHSRSNVVNSRLEYKSIEPSKHDIGSVSVQDSSNVTFGTIFKGPVAIKNVIVRRNDVRYDSNVQYNLNADPLETITKQSTEQKRVRSKRWLIIAILASVVLVITIVAAGRYLQFLVEGVNKDNLINDDGSISTSSTVIDDSDYEFIDRKQYGALPPTFIEPLTLPIRQVIISHTATSNCTDYSACSSRLRQIQDYHMKTRGWDDIGLNFVVGGDGRAYEGCGYTVGAHTYHYNRVSICIAFIGDFSSYEAPQKQLRAAQRIIDDGIKTNKIHPNYVLYGQRQLRNFNSPGILLYNQIMSWPHWSKEVIPLS